MISAFKRSRRSTRFFLGALPVSTLFFALAGVAVEFSTAEEKDAANSNSDKKYPEALCGCRAEPLAAEKRGGAVVWRNGENRPADPNAPRLGTPFSDPLWYGHVNVSVMAENLPPDQRTNGQTTVDVELKAPGVKNKDRRWPDLACFHDKILVRRPGNFSVSLRLARNGKTLDRLDGSGVIPPALTFALAASVFPVGKNGVVTGTLMPAVEETYFQEHCTLEVLLLKLDKPTAECGKILKASSPKVDMNSQWALTMDTADLPEGWYAVKIKLFDRKKVGACVFDVFQLTSASVKTASATDLAAPTPARNANVIAPPDNEIGETAVDSVKK
jgi:hypothetical protein